MIELYKGDTLEEHIWIPDGCTDLVLTDPPYGTIEGLNLKNWAPEDTAWDIAIPPADLFNIANRILRKNGRLVLFSQEPYTSALIAGAIPNLPFNYRMAWIKDSSGNHLGASKAPVSYYEDILVFTKKYAKYDGDGGHPLRPYFKKVFDFIGLKKSEVIKQLGQRVDHVFRHNSTQFEFCTEETYEDIVMSFGVYAMPDFQEYAPLEKINRAYREQLLDKIKGEAPVTFNLAEGAKSKSNLFYYAKDPGSYHPTQKPVALLEDLVQTFSRPGDTVADLTMGSGSTMVACANTGRNGYGIEREDKYFGIAEERTESALLLR